MLIDMVCDNKKCKLQGKEITKSIKHSEISEQVCEKCGEKLRRLWTSSASIKTSDGFKS